MFFGLTSGVPSENRIDLRALTLGASLKSSDYYLLVRPEPEPVALRATGQVSTLTELEKYPYGTIFLKILIRDGPDTE